MRMDWLGHDSGKEGDDPSTAVERELGKQKTVKGRFLPWLSGKSSSNLSSCTLFARKRGWKRQEGGGSTSGAV